MKQSSIYLLSLILFILIGCSSDEKSPELTNKATFKLINQYSDYKSSTMRVNTTTFVHQFDDANKSAQVTFIGDEMSYSFVLSYDELTTKTFTLPIGNYTLRVRPTSYDHQGSEFLYYSVDEVISITNETTFIEVTGTTEQSLIIVNSNDVSDGYVRISSNDSEQKALVSSDGNEDLFYIYTNVEGYLYVVYNKLGSEIVNVISDPKPNVKYLFNYGGNQGISINLDDLYQEEVVFP